MRTKIIEAVSDAGNHGKFMVCRVDDELSRTDIAGFSLILPRWGAGPDAHLLVVDLETGEGAFFRPGGLPKADLDKRRIWVCILFPAFLEWLYSQPKALLMNLHELPDRIDLTDIPLQLRGYRRPGRNEDLVAELEVRLGDVADDASRAELAVHMIEQRLRDRLLAESLPARKQAEGA